MGLEESTVKLLSSLAFAVSVLMCTMASAQENFYGHQNFYGFQQKQFEFHMGVKLMDRPGSENNFPIIRDSTLGTTILSAAQASDLNTGVGIENSLIKHTGEGVSWELKSNFVQWEEGKQLLGMGSLVQPGIAFPLDTINTQYESDYFSIELNYKRTVFNGLALLIGPKFAHLKDRFVADSFWTNPSTTTPPFPFPTSVNFVGRNERVGRNRMLGYQLGADLNLNVTGRFQVTGMIRGGQFINPIKFSNTTDSSLIAAQSRIITSDTKDGFFGEAGGRVNYDLFTGVASIYMGYEATWIDGVALAPSSFTNGTPGIATDTLFFHGAVFGLTIKR